ncbi:TPA: hypothetical protein QEM76_005632 [Pseudomonas putida]|nr:hypothetical protein [Pseudomonas putida]HDS1802913.1 hypothetical protein [Pseudomonas putida]HDS1808845.1 hypothetical protein [Pseudomonas putida]
MNTQWLRMRWLFNRRNAKAFAWTVILLALAVAANLAGIYLIGSVAGWERWMSASAGYFLAWRLCLYAATVYGWLWMRQRLLTREAAPDARRRLVRAELAGAISIVTLEASLLQA